MPTTLDSIGVIGAGAWGTALAHSGSAPAAPSRSGRVSPKPWPTSTSATTIARSCPACRSTTSFAPPQTSPTCASAMRILLACPAQHVRAVTAQLAPHVRPGQPLVICAKGIEQATGLLMGEVVAETCRTRQAVLSGPSFAADVARGLPTAGHHRLRRDEPGPALAERLGDRQLPPLLVGRLIGVELGGAVKNVLAIAAGIVDGKGLGASAHAALVTRGFAEMRRFGEALGARAETLMGLSGLGDLVLTCGSPQSRNMSLGRALGEGETLARPWPATLSVTEGVFTAAAVVRTRAREENRNADHRSRAQHPGRQPLGGRCHRGPHEPAVQGRGLIGPNAPRMMRTRDLHRTSETTRQWLTGF